MNEFVVIGVGIVMALLGYLHGYWSVKYRYESKIVPDALKFGLTEGIFMGLEEPESFSEQSKIDVYNSINIEAFTYQTED